MITCSTPVGIEEAGIQYTATPTTSVVQCSTPVGIEEAGIWAGWAAVSLRGGAQRPWASKRRACEQPARGTPPRELCSTPVGIEEAGIAR